MKKITLLLLAVLATCTGLYAQNIEVGNISIAKVNRPCVIAKYNMPVEIVKEALADKLKQSKVGKGSKVKGGFRVYKGVSIPSISDDKIDLYTRVTGKKDNSVLYIAVSKGYDNFISPKDTAEFAKLQKFVSGLMNNVNIAQIKSDISDQAKVVNKAEKSQKAVIKKGENLKNELKTLNDKIKQNKKNQETNVKNQKEAAEKVQAETAVLKELKSKMQLMLKN